MPKYNKFYDGIAASRHIQDGFDNLVNVDVHGDIGGVVPRAALYLDTTPNTPNEPCVQCTTPNGWVYLFSTISGKIWKFGSGTYTTITANANNSGHTGCIWYNGYVRYWTASKLGRFVAETEASRSDSWATFSNGKATAACEENLTLFITDGKYVTSINSSEVFNPNALDIPPQFAGTTIIPDSLTNVLIGTIIGSNVQRCRGFLWDTYSDSYTLSDEVPETGINCLINCDDMILAQCGTYGKIYQWTGQQFILWDNDFRNQVTELGWQKTVVFQSRPYIAVGNKLYSIYRQNSTMKRVLVQEYTSTSKIISVGVTLQSLIVSVTNGVNVTSGIMAIGVIDTPEAGSINDVIVDYQNHPEGIEIWTKVNGGSWEQQTPIIDTINNKVYFSGGLLNPNFVQARIVLNPSGLILPIITNITMS